MSKSRPCEITILEAAQPGYYRVAGLKSAKFLQFAQGHVDTRSGPAIVPVAIVEYEDGTVGAVELRRLRFTDVTPLQAENDRGDECIVPLTADMLEDDPYYQEGRDEENEGGS